MLADVFRCKQKGQKLAAFSAMALKGHYQNHGFLNINRACLFQGIFAVS